MANENRKRAVSIRMSGSDVSKVKRLAQRLGVRDSDVIRYAVKTMLSRLAPLYDPHVRGRSLVPVFVESGSDLFMHFDLDAMRLDDIINDDADDDRRVDHEDIQLIAMSGRQALLARWGAGPAHGSRSATLRLNATGSPVAAGDGEQGAAMTSSNLKDYLYSKYVYRSCDEA